LVVALERDDAIGAAKCDGVQDSDDLLAADDPDARRIAGIVEVPGLVQPEPT
jgi:hypothetical protein